MNDSLCHAARRAARALLLLPALAFAQADDAPGLQAVAQLAQLNGQALACQDTAAARRAKALMLAHAPKTARYGAVFDDGTQQSFLALTRSRGDCPDSAALAARLDVVARRLEAALPAAAAAR